MPEDVVDGVLLQNALFVIAVKGGSLRRRIAAEVRCRLVDEIGAPAGNVPLDRCRIVFDWPAIAAGSRRHDFDCLSRSHTVFIDQWLGRYLIGTQKSAVRGRRQGDASKRLRGRILSLYPALCHGVARAGS